MIPASTVPKDSCRDPTSNVNSIECLYGLVFIPPRSRLNGTKKSHINDQSRLGGMNFDF